MTLPAWALQALETYRPLPAYGETVPNSQNLASWQFIAARLKSEWSEIDAGNWNIPKDVDRASASTAILECAIECSRHVQLGRGALEAADAAKQISALNERICQCAETLAELFATRNALLERFSLDDWQSSEPDPFRLWDALEAVAGPSSGFVGAIYQSRTSSRQTAGYGELFGLISRRTEAGPAPVLAIDLAAMESRKKNGPASLARQLFVVLENRSSLAGVALLDCLNVRQLAGLIRAAYGFNEDAIHADIVKAQLFRHKKSRTIREP